MTKKEFTSWAQREVIILDGATGSSLMKAGLPKGVCTELWTLEHPEVLIDLQRAYVQAGSRILYAPTFGANRMSLESYGLGDKTKEMNQSLVALSKKAAEGKAFIAGDITTTGKLVGSSDEVSYEAILELYKEQITYLEESGVDMIVAETMLGVDETMAAVDAASAVCDLPILCTLTVEADGSLYSGGNILDAAEALEAMGASAVGLNCSVGPDQLEAIIACMKERVSIPIIAKPNAGIPTITENGEAVYSMNQNDFAENMMKLITAGAGIAGGCCGTDPSYIQKLVHHLQNHMTI